MCFHGNRVSWGINYSFISLYSKYQPSSFICSPIMLAPIISSLDEIYCISLTFRLLKNFSIFLMIEMIVDRFLKVFRKCQRNVFTASNSIFIKIRESLLWFYDDFFLAHILAMMSEQKRSSHVQTAQDFKPFET